MRGLAKRNACGSPSLASLSITGPPDRAAHDFGALVERFARRVVDRRADDLHVDDRPLLRFGYVPADQQAEETESRGAEAAGRAGPESVGEDVPLQMIDLHQRNVVGDRESFGE